MIILLSIVVVLLALALITMQGRYVHLKKSIDKGKVSMYDKLRDSEEDKTRLKRQLTQNVAHELKTPVSSIQGYLETIVSNPDIDKETKDQFIQRCYAQSPVCQAFSRTSRHSINSMTPLRNMSFNQ